ncbi:type II toxin-antitoxin system HicB family antitoxin [Chryseobacterium arthrosphaerae]|uniref:type II toxin-antitoxin system HicB family antitoxin n=1 Tax=Chryseobacterium arthrosphaerae TaxID=651561 RepID=UPI003D3529C8
MLEYRDIKGTVEFDQETKMFFGKLVEINGLVMYEAENAEEFEKNFISAVDEYIQMCEENEMPIKKEYKGVFNVRTSPEIHERLVGIAIERGTRLNTIINEAFDLYLSNTKSNFPLIDYGSKTIGYTKVSGLTYAQQGLAVTPLKTVRKHIQKAVKARGSKTTIPKNKISKQFPRHHDESK